MEQQLLVANKIFFKRDLKVIINNLSFKIQPGYLFLLKGDNGIGKSTLLKLISGLLPLHSGKIYYNGTCSKIYKNIYQQNMFYISDKCSLKKELSIIENLSYLMLLKGYKINLEKMKHALEYVDLHKVKNLKIKEISKGQKQRVLLASLILMKRKIWLLDEPVANLDTKGKYLFNKILINHLKKSGTAIISIHDKLNYLFFEYKYRILNLNNRCY